MFNQPKRHPYHDFPLSLAKEYLTELDPHQVQKSWSKRQIIYQDYPRLTVLHDAFDWQCSDAVILEFCKVRGDQQKKSRHSQTTWQAHLPMQSLKIVILSL